MAESKNTLSSSGLMEEEKPERLGLDTSRTIVRKIFDLYAPKITTQHLKCFIAGFGDQLPYDQYDEIVEGVWAHVSAYISPTAKITAPSIICGGASIGHFSHVSCSVIGAFAVIGDLSTVENSIIFDKASMRGHNSVSHSIIGYYSKLEQGVIISDFCSSTAKASSNAYSASKVKEGAIICDEAIIGAGCVVDPSAIVGLCARIEPMTEVKGYYRPYYGIK